MRRKGRNEGEGVRGEGKWNAREEKWIISAHDTRQEKFSPPRRGGETRAVEFPRLKFSIRNGIKYLNGWFTRGPRGRGEEHDKCYRDRGNELRSRQLRARGFVES